MDLTQYRHHPPHCNGQSPTSQDCHFFLAPKFVGTPVIVPSHQGLSNAEVQWCVTAFRFGSYTPARPQRQKNLNCDTFWKLMDWWNVPTDRALTLIGRDAEPVAEAERPRFPLSDEQAKVVSWLLEIELTLRVAGVERPEVVSGAEHQRTKPCRSTRWGDVIRAGRFGALVVESNRRC
jgi:hypothetical protein